MEKTTLAEVRRLRAEAEKIEPAARLLPALILADWLDERGIDGAALRLPVKRCKFTVSGDFHGGSATLIGDVVEETSRYTVVCLSRAQIRRANRKLCGIAECCCRDGFTPDDGRDFFYDDTEEYSEHRIYKD